MAKPPSKAAKRALKVRTADHQTVAMNLYIFQDKKELTKKSLCDKVRRSGKPQRHQIRLTTTSGPFSHFEKGPALATHSSMNYRRKYISRSSLMLLLLFSQSLLAKGLLCAGLFGSSSLLSDPKIPLPTSFSIVELQKQNPGIRFFPDFVRSGGKAEVFSYQDADFISMGERVLFLVKDPQTLITWGVINGNQPEVHIREFPGTRAFDITNSPLISPLIRKINQEKAWTDGPNCWNLCQIYNGWAKTSFFTSAEEFHLWMNSPFAKKVDIDHGDFPVDPGSILVLRDYDGNGQVKEIHGAIALSKRLVLTKNGKDANQPYQLMTTAKMMNLYSSMTSMNSVELYTFTSFDKAWSEWKPRLSPVLANSIQRWMDFESDHGQHYLPRKSSGPVAIPQQQRLQAQKKKLVDLLKPSVDAAIENFSTVNALSELQKVELFFLKLLHHRLTNNYYFSETPSNQRNSP